MSSGAGQRPIGGSAQIQYGTKFCDFSGQLHDGDRAIIDRTTCIPFKAERMCYDDQADMMLPSRSAAEVFGHEHWWDCAMARMLGTFDIHAATVWLGAQHNPQSVVSVCKLGDRLQNRKGFDARRLLLILMLMLNCKPPYIQVD